MSNTTFKFYAVNMLKGEKEIEADYIKLISSGGQEFHLKPRKSDGDIVLYTENRLVIHPIASNCARIEDL